MNDEFVSSMRIMTRYRDLLASPGVSRMVLAGIVSRLPTSMLAIALPLVVVGRTGSFVSAGLASAFFTIAAGVSGPFRGRLVDRVGAPLVLAVTGWGQALALIGTVLAAVATSNIVWLSGIATLAGLLTPPVSPVMRVLWTRLARQDLRDAAFAFESITLDMLYIIGPTLVALLIAIAPIDAPMVIAAVFSASGTSVLALAPGTRGWRRTTKAVHWLGPLRSGAVRRMLPIGFLIPGSLTAVELGNIAFASEHGARALAGILIAALSVGGIIGGIYWGGRAQPGTPRRQLTLLLLATGAGMALLTLSSNILLLGGLLVLIGLAVTPSITVEYRLMDAVASPHEITESFSWLNTVGQAGAAAAVAVAGLFITRLHNTGGFVLAATLAGAGSLYCALLAPDANQHLDDD